MIHIDAAKAAISLLNSTLGLDALPTELHGRLATALVLLDQQEGEDFIGALRDAYAYIEKDVNAMDQLINGMEASHD